MQPSFFDFDDRHKKLNERDPLLSLNELVNWEIFKPHLNKLRQKQRKSNAGRKPFDALMMFKAMVLQHLYNLSDDELEYQIRDRLSFSRFLGLHAEDKTPDAKTFWLFREQIANKGLMKQLFLQFNKQLNAQGYSARKGQIVDASFVSAPKQRNTKEENQQIKEGHIPERFNNNAHVKSQKDCDARWAKKNNVNYFGYKNHISIDNKNKLIRKYEMTSAEVHDSQMISELIAENSNADVWADSAYRSEEIEATLKLLNCRSKIHKKGYKNRPLTENEHQGNKTKSTIRARVEHVFGSMTNEQNGMCFQVIGKVRMLFKVGMMNLVYNLRRFVTLQKTSVFSE